MYIRLRELRDRNLTYLLRIWLEEMPNKLAAVRYARLDCTCDEFRTARDCRHTHQAKSQLQRWQAAETRKLERQILGNRKKNDLVGTLSTITGSPLQECEIFALPNGRYAVQKETSIETRYSPNCGWGTGGKEVVLLADWPEAGIVEVLKDTPDFPLGCPELEMQLHIGIAPMPLPPNLELARHKCHLRNATSQGSGLIDLFEEAPIAVTPTEGGRVDHGRFWAAVFGFRLESPIFGQGEYLPGYIVEGQPASALALDLAKGRLRLIPEQSANSLSAGVPQEFQNRIGHTHLPWGANSRETAPYQVILRHPSLSQISRNGPVEVLTTNLWSGAKTPWPEPLKKILAQTAALLLNMGHTPDALLSHGRTAKPLAEVAKYALISHNGGAFPLNKRGRAVLVNEIIPIILQGKRINLSLRHKLGPEWTQLMSDTQENSR